VSFAPYSYVDMCQCSEGGSLWFLKNACTYVPSYDVTSQNSVILICTTLGTLDLKQMMPKSIGWQYLMKLLHTSWVSFASKSFFIGKRKSCIMLYTTNTAYSIIVFIWSPQNSNTSQEETTYEDKLAWLCSTGQF
jgi:hypothetical protein